MRRGVRAIAAGLTLVLIAGGTASARSLPIHAGDRGAAVRLVQRLLSRDGFPARVDGVFGPATVAAVRRFQRAAGLPIVGYVGPRTLAALRSGRVRRRVGARDRPPRRAATPCSSAPGAGSTVTRWRPVVTCVLRLLGQRATERVLADVFIVIAGESGGNPTAENRWDSNARAGHPSRGLLQVTQPTFDANRSSALRSDVFDPAANVYAGLRYALRRYGAVARIPGVRLARESGRYQGYARVTSADLRR